MNNTPVKKAKTNPLLTVGRRNIQKKTENMTDGNCTENSVPKHIAIIMDGNGRWAEAQGKPRNYGHQAGVETARKITAECTRMGVKFLTLYTFSTEN